MEHFDTERDNLFEGECSSLADLHWERLFRINSGLYLADYCFQSQRWTFSFFCFRVNIALDFWFCQGGKICWKYVLRRSPRKFSRSFFFFFFFLPPDVKKCAVILIWGQMGSATCSRTSYYLLWFLSVFLASRLGSITVHTAYGGREWKRRKKKKKGRGSPLPSRLETALWNPMIRGWPSNQGRWSRLILSCFKMPHSQTSEARCYIWDASHSSRIFFFFFFFPTAAPLFFPRWPSHIKAQPWILRRKWAQNYVSWYAGETIKEETDRAIREAPGPVSCCSRAG